VVKKADPSPALLEMLERSGELEHILSGRGLRFLPVKTIATPSEPRQISFPKPDWDDEARKAKAAECEACIAEATALLESVEPPPAPDPPAPKQSRWRRGAA
jgi:hypothetical protein